MSETTQSKIIENHPVVSEAGGLRDAGSSLTKTFPRGGKTFAHWGVILAAVAAAAVALLYAFYTDDAWEDFFITFRQSRNLCDGKGLVYNPGERVHGFTSPLGTLLPALCYWVSGKHSFLTALWLFRFLCVGAFAGAVALLWQGVKNADPAGRLAPWFLAALLVFDPKAVSFTINGMETAFMLLFLAWAVFLFTRGPGHWLATGLCWAGLMWTRPDGCVYIAVLALVTLIWSGERSRVMGSLLKSAAVCAFAYLPWFAWAWVYYGSPIPHTIIAKANVDLGAAMQLFYTLRGIYIRFPHATAVVFQPTYYDYFPFPLGPAGHWLLRRLTLGLGLFCAFYWLIPVKDRLGRMTSLGFALLCLYLSYLTYIFPWYMPPVAMLGLVVLARGIPTLAGALAARLPRGGRLRPAAVLAGAALLMLLAGQAALFVLTIGPVYQANQGKAVGLTSLVAAFGPEAKERDAGGGPLLHEGRHSNVIGTWLREHVWPTESVYLEPLGELGYYCGARMVDWPGLVAPEVVRLRKEKKLNQSTVVPELQPDWVVFRTSEVEAMAQSPAAKFFNEHYELVQSFEIPPEKPMLIFRKK